MDIKNNFSNVQTKNPNESIEHIPEIEKREDIRPTVNNSISQTIQSGYEQKVIEQEILLNEKTEEEAISVKTIDIGKKIDLTSTNQEEEDEVVVVTQSNCHNSSLWECSTFYMDLGKMYTDEIPHSNSTISQNPPPLQVHSSYPILLSSLSNEEDWSETSYSFSNDWEDRFDQLKQEVLSNYIMT